MKKFLLNLFILLFSCTNPPQISPEWIISEPNSDSNYWVGIGSVEKPFPENYREIAQKRALNQIASQIKVEVKSEFNSVVQDLNFDLNEYFSLVINSRVNQEIDFVEYVDSYESRNSYSVFSRLSISKYFSELEKKRNIAKEASLEYLTNSEPFNVNSFNLLSLAFKEVEPHLDQNLDISDPFNENRSINLATLIKLKLFDFLDRVQIIPDTNPFKIKQFSGDESLYKAKCIDKKTGEPLSNIPIAYKINSDVINKFVTSNEKGFIIIDPFKDLGSNQLEFITHVFNIKSLVDKSILFLINKNLRSTRVPFNIQPINIYFNSNETNLGVLLDPPFISSSIKEFLSSNISCNYSNKNNADFIIKLNVNSKAISQDPDLNGFFFVYANAQLSIISTRDNKELYSKSIIQVKGGHINVNMAGMKALDNLQKKIEVELPLLISIL